MYIPFKLDASGYEPVKAHPEDAGFDIRTPYAFILQAGESITIDSGVHMLIPEGYCGLMVSKSGLNVMHGINSTGLIDAGYDGSIKVKLYNYSDTDRHFLQGDKITQICILPVPDIRLNKVDEFDVEYERGSAGFGSSGR